MKLYQMLSTKCRSKCLLFRIDNSIVLGKLCIVAPDSQLIVPFPLMFDIRQKRTIQLQLDNLGKPEPG